MKEMLNKIYTALVWHFVVQLGILVILILLAAKTLKAGELEPTGTITLNVNGIIKTYPANEYKVERLEALCYEPKDPCIDCKEREKKLIEELHKKMSFPCAPCKKCEAELENIKGLKSQISTLYAKIQFLERENKRLENELDDKPAVEPPAPIVKTVTRDVIVKRDFILEGLLGYGEDGMIGTDYYDKDGYLNAETYNGIVGGIGATYFITDRFGLGVQAQFGEISRAVLGKVSIGF